VWTDPSHDENARLTPSGPLCPGVRTWQSSAGECPNAGSSVRIMAATARLACTHCTHRAQNRRHNACEGRVISVGREHGLINISSSQHNACEGRGISVGRERGRINISSSTAHLLRRAGLRARLDQQALRQGALAQQRAQHLRAATHHEQHRAHNNACEGRVISVTRDRGRSNISWRAQNACGCRVISVARGRGRSDISIITTCMGSAPSCVARQCSTSCSAPTQCIAAGWRRPLRLTLS
jgi:hypothetical protein